MTKRGLVIPILLLSSVHSRTKHWTYHCRHHDIQHDDTQHNDIEPNNK
jgi:hypothetical protein